jgi:putative inorganic carbon (HCO3(-)) transporter
MTAITGRLLTSPRTPVVLGPLAASVLICAAAALTGFVTAERGLIMIGALLALVTAIALALRPDRATLIVVAILYSNAAAIAVQRYDIPYFAGAAFPLLLIVPFAYHIVVRRQPIIIASGLPFMLGYFVVVILGIAAGMAADPDRALDMLVTFIVEGLLIYVAVTNSIRSLADLRMVVWVLLAVGFFLGALSIHQQVTESFASDYGGFAKVSEAVISTGTGTPEASGQPRLSGPIGEKNRYAQIMVVLLPLGMFRVWGERRTVLRVLAATATLVTAFGAVLTFSRGAALGLAVAIALMALFRYIKPSQLIAVVLGVAVLFTLQPSYLERLTTLDALGGATGTRGSTEAEDGSIRKRANETIAALLVFADHPVIGVGRGLFPLYYGDYADEVGIASENEARQAHNLYAGIAAETGLLGFLSFMGVFGATLFALDQARRRWRIRAPEYADMATGFILALVTYLTTGMFLHLAYERYMWIILALAGSAAYLGLKGPLTGAGKADGHASGAPAIPPDASGLPTGPDGLRVG